MYQEMALRKKKKEEFPSQQMKRMGKNMKARKEIELRKCITREIVGEG